MKGFRLLLLILTALRLPLEPDTFAKHPTKLQARFVTHSMGVRRPLTPHLIWRRIPV